MARMARMARITLFILNPSKLEALAALQCPYNEIASGLGISTDTLERRRKECPELDDAIKRGREEDIEKVGLRIRDRLLSSLPEAAQGERSRTVKPTLAQGFLPRWGRLPSPPLFSESHLTGPRTDRSLVRGPPRSSVVKNTRLDP